MAKIESCRFYNPETQECIFRTKAIPNSINANGLPSHTSVIPRISSVPSQGREVHRGTELVIYCKPGITTSDLPERLQNWQKRCTFFTRK